jgi:hypothetical protein
VTERPPGPIEAATWPSELTAHVVTLGHDPHLHGYSVERDLARNGGFSETLLLALRGGLPSASECRAAELALMFLAPLPVSEGPTHAAVLGRVCGARSSAILGIAAVALAERARHTLERYAPILVWLDAPAAPYPAGFSAASRAERESVERLAELMQPVATDLAVFLHDPDRTAAVLAALHFAGLRRREQLEPMFVIASLAPAMAEALAREPGSFQQYPMQLPPFEYTEGPLDR